MKYSRSDGDCFVLAFEVEFGSQINITHTFIITASCDEQYALYRIVLS